MILAHFDTILKIPLFQKKQPRRKRLPIASPRAVVIRRRPAQTLAPVVRLIQVIVKQVRLLDKQTEQNNLTTQKRITNHFSLHKEVEKGVT